MSTLNIRQLLYPELAWKSIIKERKAVHTYVFLYEAPYFRFIPFVYDPIIGFRLEGGSEIIYRFQSIQVFDLKDINQVSSPEIDMTVPFPQANSFDKVLIMLRKISEYGMAETKEDLLAEMAEYDLAGRQIDYYLNCLRWLKLVSIDSR